MHIVYRLHDFSYVKQLSFAHAIESQSLSLFVEHVLKIELLPYNQNK